MNMHFAVILFSLTFSTIFARVTYHDQPNVVRMTKEDDNNFNLDTCTECEEIIGTVHLLISNNETQQALLSAAMEGCGLLPPSLKAECTQLINQYGQAVLNGIIEYLADPSQLCTTIGLCSKEINQKLAQKMTDIQRSRKLGISSCALCEFIMEIIQEILQDKPMQQFFSTQFDRLCTFLPAEKDITECKTIIQTFEPKAYMYIVQNFLAPTTFCPALSIC